MPVSLLGNVSVPVLGLTNQRLQGSFQDAADFSLSTPVTSLTIGSFTLSNDTVTFSEAAAGRFLEGERQRSIAPVRQCGLHRHHRPERHISLTANLPTFSLPGGFITITNDTLTLSSATDYIQVNVHLSILQIGNADFTGKIHANLDYELDASPTSLTIGGFTIPLPPSPAGPILKLINGELDIGFDYDIPELSDFGDEGDGFSFSGSYSLDGQWSLTATASITFTIGPVVVTQESLTLTNNSLTLTADWQRPRSRSAGGGDREHDDLQ